MTIASSATAFPRPPVPAAVLDLPLADVIALAMSSTA